MKRPGSSTSIAGLAVAGAAAAHALSYTAVAGSQASQLLHHSGHGYWGNAVAVAVASGLIATAVILGRRVRQPESPPIAFAARLAAVQTVLFVIVEVAERLAAGVPVGAVFSSGLLVVGLAFQVVVAVAITGVITFLGRGAERVARILRHPIPAPNRRPVWLATVPAVVCSLERRTPSYFVRGPPQPSS